MLNKIKPKQVGLDAVLSMFGMGDIASNIDALISSGAIDKIISFANQLEQLHERLNRLERILTSDGDRAAPARVPPSACRSTNAGHSDIVFGDQTISGDAL